jgi:small GTP-binding protein
MSLLKRRLVSKEIKLTIVGNSTVGKSTLVARLSKNRFIPNLQNTVGGAFCTMSKEYNKKIYKFQMWDTAGQERYKSLVPMYMKDSKIVLIVFDITSVDSFNSVKDCWFDFADSSVPDAHKILIGSKLDLKGRRAVSKEAAKEFADIYDLDYVECSSKTEENVDDLLATIIRKAVLIEESAKDEDEKDELLKNIVELHDNEGEGGWLEYVTTNCGSVFSRCAIM